MSKKCSTDNPQSTNPADTAPNSSDPKKRLTLKQQIFVKDMVNLNKDTFLNASRSYKASHPLCKDTSAPAAASRMLKNDNVKLAIVEELEHAGFDSEVLAHTYADIMRGEYRSVSTTTQRNKEGEVVSVSETVSSPKPSDVAKIGAQYFAVTGIKDAGRAVGDAAGREVVRRLIEKQGLPMGKTPRGGRG